MSGRPARKGRSPSRKADEVAAPVGRPKSAGRQKSPSRPKSPGRPKSPTRGAAKSPGRKSPGRQAAKRSPSPPPRKPSSRAAALASKKVITPPRFDDVVIDLKSDKIKVASYVAAAAERERSNSKVSSVPANSRERTLSAEVSAPASSATRRSARMASLMQEKLKVENDVPTSANNVASTSEREFGKQPPQTPREFGGWLGVFVFMLVVPAILIASQLYCTQKKCPDVSFPTAISRNWQDYLDAKVAACFVGFVVLQLLFSLLPLGRLVDAPPARTGRYQYRCNGVYSLILTFATIGGLCYLEVPILNVLDKQPALAVSAFIFSLLLTIFLYVRARWAPVSALNPHGNTGNFLVDFWMGREVNPRLFGRVDLKWVCYRIALVGMIVLNVMLVVKELDSQTRKTSTGEGKHSSEKIPWAEKNYPLALCLAATLQALYALDSIVFEHAFPGTFDGSHEGLGYMITVGLLTYPFVPSIIVKFIARQKEEVPLYGLALIVLMFTVGYIIYRASNSQKTRFRQNPLDPALAHLETIQTSRGKKLLVSGWWGWVRHPNYLGDILMQWSWAACAGGAHWLPYLVPLAWTTFFLHRAVRDSARCSQRYGVYWERYTQRVKSLVIPKVF